MVGEDRREPGAAGRQALRHVLVVERDANNEWRRLDVRGSDGKAARLRLSARDCLQQRSQPA
jgi:cell division protein FtsL